MAYTTINKSSDYFNTKLYTGNGSTQSITGVGFQPDWVWTKERSGVCDHHIFDVLRGATYKINSASTEASSADANTLTSFDSDGFSVGTNPCQNNNTDTYVSWNWKANGSGSANTDGSISSTVSANTTSGFSIVKYTGTGSNATIGHGLNTAPTAIFVKNLDAAEQWINYDVSNGPTKYYHLNLADAAAVGSTIWNNTAPTTSVFSVGTVVNVNTSGENYVAYCFSNIAGFSKIGSYTGNGSLDGTFIYTGFKPAWAMFKKTSASADWFIMDNKRDPHNEMIRDLRPNITDAENANTTYNDCDFISNGIKIREDNGDFNESGATYIYMAFAEAPLVGSNNVPATAR